MLKVFRLLKRANESLADGISKKISGFAGTLLHYFIVGQIATYFSMAVIYLAEQIYFNGIMNFIWTKAEQNERLVVFEAMKNQGKYAELIKTPELFPAVVFIIVVMALCTIAPLIAAIQAHHIYKEQKQNKHQTFGKARFARAKELIKTGLSGNGVFFGRKDGRFVEKPPEVEGHVLIVGGSGTGKSAGVVIPTLFRWPGAALVMDIKGELSKVSANAREGEVFIFDPENGGDSYDPLLEANTLDGAQQLARYLIPEPKDSDPFWSKAAQGILAAATLEGALNHDTITDVAERLCVTPGSKLIQELTTSENRQVRLLASVALEMPEKTLGGVMAELKSKLLTLASDDNIRKVTSHSTWTPASLESGSTVYLKISEHMLEQYKELWALIIGQVMRYLSKRPEQSVPAILISIDELPRFKKMPGFLEALATLRSRNVHVMSTVQSMAQLDDIYGKDKRKIIADNCSFKFVLSASDPETQKYFSDLAGQKTALAKGTTYGAGLVPNMSRTEQGTPLLRPEEWANLTNPILFSPKNQPSEVELVLWFKDKELKRYCNLRQIS